MPRVYLTSYATGRFEEVRRDLNVSAIRFGIENVVSFNRKDLTATRFYEENKQLLDETCGAGWWAWKPFFILRSLEMLSENDILIYSDSGSLFVAPPDPLIDLCQRHPQGIIPFDIRPITNRQFTKRDCFVRLGCDSAKYWDGFMAFATIIFIRKCPAVMPFLEEWLGHCQDRATVTDDENICGLPDLPGYLQHRHDQSIFSVLCQKYDFEMFRNPTMWSNFLKLPEHRVSGEMVTSPFGLPPAVSEYATAPQVNSPYGTLFEINRLPNFEGKRPLQFPGSGRRTPSQRLATAISKLKKALSR